jgi:hypothetical protein
MLYLSSILYISMFWTKSASGLGVKWDITNYFMKYSITNFFKFSAIIYEYVLKKIFLHAPFSQWNNNENTLTLISFHMYKGFFKVSAPKDSLYRQSGSVEEQCHEIFLTVCITFMTYLLSSVASASTFT